MDESYTDIKKPNGEFLSASFVLFAVVFFFFCRLVLSEAKAKPMDNVTHSKAQLIMFLDTSVTSENVTNK